MPNLLRPRSSRRARLGLDLLEDRSTPTVSAITADFNSSSINAGNTIWFNSAAKVTGLGSGTETLKITDATVSFTANGTAYSVNVPNTTVTFTGLATKATTTFSGDGWLITTPPVFNGNVFIGGASLKAPSAGGLLGGLLGGLGLAGGFPGGIHNVTWKANFTADTPGLTVAWQWGAAVYSNFNTSPGSLGVKAVDDSQVDLFGNADRAGTPENYKSALTSGARGTGHGNYTGTYTASATVVPEAPAPATGSLAGSIYEELDGVDGYSAGDNAIANVEVDLTGTDSLGNDVSMSVFTDASGNYSFTSLRPGTYSISKVTPDGFNDGAPHVGTVNGVEDGSQGVSSIMNVVLEGGNAGINYNFEVYQVAY
jgi:SdrD B-like domain